MHLTSLYFPTYYICLITAKANITLGGQDTDDRKAKIDHHKDDQLAKQKDGKGHWKRELSSNSESAVCGRCVLGLLLGGLGG